MLKRFIIGLLALAGVPSLMRHTHRRDLTILLYHGVAPHEDRGMYNYRGKFIPPDVFARHLEHIQKHYSVLDLDEALEKQQAGMLPPNPLVITFDDGYKNFYEHAFPALQKARMTAAFFLPTDFVFEGKPLWMDRLEYLGLPNDASIRTQLKSLSDEEKEARLVRLEEDHHKKLADNMSGSVYAPLTLDEIREMQNAGMKFGAHTKSHPILSKIKRDRLEAEIKGSKDLLKEKIGSISNIFCYPNGQSEDINRDVLQETKAEFAGALSTLEGITTTKTDRYILKRISMDALHDRKSVEVAVSGARAFFRP